MRLIETSAHTLLVARGERWIINIDRDEIYATTHFRLSSPAFLICNSNMQALFSPQVIAVPVLIVCKSIRTFVDRQ